MPTPLPKVDSGEVQLTADDLSAYNTCLEYEEKFTSFKHKLRYIRNVGSLLLYAPNQGIRSEVTNCVHSCKDSSDLINIGKVFECHVIIPFKRFKDQSPEPSEHSSNQDEVKVNITQAPKNHEDSKHRLEYSASILAILQRFRHDISKFNGNNIHSLTNVISVGCDARDLFDRLELYFEATDRYEVKCFGGPTPCMRQFVTFSTPDPKIFPVPAPELLALHATCCKVARLSGAAEYIDKIDRDADEIGVLSTAASGDVLSYLLSSLSNP